MKPSQVVALVVVLLAVAALSWFFLWRPVRRQTELTIYYTKIDGTSLAKWAISQRPPEPNESPSEYERYEVMYAAVQNVAGPPSDVQAVRFPAGTHVDGVTVNGSVATVDLSDDVTNQSGTFGENGEFKALVYTLTAIPGIDAVQVTVGGHVLQTLPHGNLELDAPLHRSDW